MEPTGDQKSPDEVREAELSRINLELKQYTTTNLEEAKEEDRAQMEHERDLLLRKRLFNSSTEQNVGYFKNAYQQLLAADVGAITLESVYRRAFGFGLEYEPNLIQGELRVALKHAREECPEIVD